MRGMLLGCAMTLALAGTSLAQPAQAPGVTSTRFTDPTEGALTLDVPQGWRVAGGVKRFAPSDAKGWVTAVSPNGLTELFPGDPNVPMFALPNPSRGLQEGGQTPGLHGTTLPVMYRPGAEFAALYGTRSLGAACNTAQLQGMQPQPDLADEIRAKMPRQVRGRGWTPAWRASPATRMGKGSAP